MAEKKKSRVVVEAPASEATAQFVQWLTRHPKIAFRLDPSDITVEMISGVGGVTVLRYTVRTAERAETSPPRPAGVSARKKPRPTRTRGRVRAAS